MTPVLFTRRRSIYHQLGADCYDDRRDARTWPGGQPAIAHPPCRAWGRYAYKAKATPEEKALAPWALDMIRTHGGLLEHPRSSQLWKLLTPDDRFIDIYQCDFGHRAAKHTRLFFAKLGPMPPLPMPVAPTNTVENMWRAEREATPRALAEWLLAWVQA